VVLFDQLAADAHVCEFDLPSVVHDEVFGLKVAVDDVVAVQLLERLYDARRHELGFVFGEDPAFADV